MKENRTKKETNVRGGEEIGGKRNERTEQKRKE